MSRALAVLCLPPLLVAALVMWGGPTYARFLAAGSGLLREVHPPGRVLTAVRVDAERIVVHAPAGVTRLHVGGIAWSLPVLLCLWAWTVRGRWGWLALVTLGFVLLHVLVTDIRVRSAAGAAAGLAYTFAHAWSHWLSAALAAFVVALAWATGRARTAGGTRPGEANPE